MTQSCPSPNFLPGRLALLVFMAILIGGSATLAAPATAPVDPNRPYLLHLPGIGGELPVDHWLTNGLKRGQVPAQIEIYDWTCGDPGLNALHAFDRNQQQAQKIADKLLGVYRQNPHRPIYLTAHSGGNGLLVWALEKLPPEVKVESVLMLAPALSPQYDLTAALKHVRGKVCVFSSLLDSAVLGTGTKLCGTIDGVKCEAAGRLGFTRPDSADPAEYAKLIPRPYDRAWMQYGNVGEHIGPLMPRFAQYVLAPLVGGRADPATRPTIEAQSP